MGLPKLSLLPGPRWGVWRETNFRQKPNLSLPITSTLHLSSLRLYLPPPGTSLCIRFPDLFKCVVDKEVKVSAYMSRVGGHVVWNPTLRRNLKENEESQFMLLLNLLEGSNIAASGEDERVWTVSKDGSFSISSFSLSLSGISRERNVLSNIWKINAPPRVVIFGWLALQKRILTMDNLRRRGRIVGNDCPMCLRNEESVDHLLLNCMVAQLIWRSVVEWFDCC